MAKVILIHSGLHNEKIPGLLKGAGIKTWYPLISNYERIMELKRVLGGIAECKEIGDTLQNAAAEMRGPFYETTAELGRRYSSVEWWASTISERNTMICNLFLHCCYIYLATQWMKAGRDLCIITDSNAVMRNIASVVAKEGVAAESHACLSLKDKPIRVFTEGLFKLVLHLGVFAAARINKLYHRLITGKYNPLKNPDVILHTWGDEKCFGADGLFKDRYFTILPEYYRRNNVRTATFVSFSYRNITRSIWNAFSFFHTNKDHFIILQDHYCIWDYLFPFRIRRRQRRFRFNPVVIKNVDCSILFGEYHRNEPVRFESMYYLLFKRLAKKGIKPRVVMDGFENLFTDKLIQLGVREFMPGTTVYGFFHVAPSPNTLSFFIDEKERETAPVPDKIICNGRRYKEILMQEHYPEDRIVIGAALRYLYLHNIRRASAALSGDFKILLVLPIEKETIMELFYKLKEAVEGIEGFRVILKPHPMQTSFVKTVVNDFLPGTEIFTGPMDEALDLCDIVVSGATGAVLDCVMADKEVIRIGRSAQIDLDPLAWFEEFGRPCGSISELRERLIEAEKRMRDPSYSPPRYSVMLPELFSPATEEAMKAFLPPE
ncbi:MAG TPA: hypothetical protein PLX02_05040 [Syntrophorhabdaceae bacterium]|nr:hypothetical protein [Syntrophorhabdaceae bacterium]HQM80969.1 hypothetical protein [Syntrophorhabdaceae bacterium]